MQQQQSVPSWAAAGPADPWVLPFRPGSGHGLQVLHGLLTSSPLHPSAHLTVATIAVPECLKCLPISGASYSSSLQPISTLYKVENFIPTPPLYSCTSSRSQHKWLLLQEAFPDQTRPLDTKQTEYNHNYYCIIANTYRTLAVCQMLF